MSSFESELFFCFFFKLRDISPIQKTSTLVSLTLKDFLNRCAHLPFCLCALESCLQCLLCQSAPGLLKLKPNTTVKLTQIGLYVAMCR